MPGYDTAAPRRQRDAHALTQIVAPATVLVRLDKLIVPANLDGHDGLYRGPQAQCLLSAHND